jgi:hypothetical protein
MAGRHTVSCGSAKRHECHCSGCMGAQHGWPGCLDMARGTSKVSLAERRDEIDNSWKHASRSQPKRRRERPTKAQKESATDSVVVDLVDWLGHHLTTAEQVEAIAKEISEDVVAELDRSFDAADRTARGRELAKFHFWCDILAALAKTLDEVQEEINKVVDLVPNLVVSAINPQSPIGQVTVRLAVDKTWERIKDLDFVKATLGAFDLSEPLRAIRMLAVMTCPAPERHEAAAKFCMHPLIGEYVSTNTKQRLETALPQEWLT